jgi:hypothetical protein
MFLEFDLFLSCLQFEFSRNCFGLTNFCHVDTPVIQINLVVQSRFSIPLLDIIYYIGFVA